MVGIWAALGILGGAAAIVTLWGPSRRLVKRIPYRISRTDRAAADEQSELLGLAQAVLGELETCRYRLAKAKKQGQGWFVERQLPAETHHRWTQSLSTAHEVDVNDALRGFYVWADEINATMSARASAETMSVGGLVRPKALALDDDDVTELDEGLSRIKNAQEHLGELIKRLCK
jgi:hypothetical protein